MPESQSLSEIERQYTEGGRPSLGEAFKLLKSDWDMGVRDRESSLRLLFLAWYACSEPPALTGLSGIEDDGALFREIYETLGGAFSDDSEFLFVAGYMLSLFPWCAGPDDEWLQRSRQCLNRWRGVSSGRVDPEVFEGRGAYGHYFAHIARTGWSGV